MGKRFLLPVTYFPTNIVYPFTLRVTGIKRWLSSIPFYSTSNGYKSLKMGIHKTIQLKSLKLGNPIVEYLIPVTQREMEICKPKRD